MKIPTMFRKGTADLTVWSVLVLVVSCLVSGFSVKTLVNTKWKKGFLAKLVLRTSNNQVLPLGRWPRSTSASCGGSGGAACQNPYATDALGSGQLKDLFCFCFLTKMWKHSKLKSCIWSYDHLIYPYYQNYYTGSGFFLCYKGLILLKSVTVTQCDF